MHAVPAKQRVPKLGHSDSTAISRIAIKFSDTNSMLGVHLSVIGLLTTGRRLPIFGVSFYPTMVVIFIQLQDTFAIPIKYETYYFILLIQIWDLFVINTGIHSCYFFFRLRKGLPSANALKGQTKLYEQQRLLSKKTDIAHLRLVPIIRVFVEPCGWYKYI